MARGLSGRGTAKDEIAADLRRRIEAGEFDGDPEGRLPTKNTLASHYGVSTQTANVVYARLIQEGVVISRWRDGYFIRRTDITLIHADTYERRARHEARYQAGSGDFWEEDVRAQGRQPYQEVEVRLVTPPPKPVAERLSLGPLDTVLVRDRLRHVDGVPNMIAASYFPEDLARGTVLAKSGNRAVPGGMLASIGHPYTWTRNEHRARMPTQEETSRLTLPDATAVDEWIVTRYARDGGAPLAVMIAVVPGDRGVVVYDRIDTT